MSDENKVGTYPFVAEPFHVDFMERLTMGVLGNHLLNCAGFHAAERGFGIATLNENHYTWVLSRLAIEMGRKCPGHMRNSVCRRGWRMFTVCLRTETLPSSTRRESPSGYACSIWAMISMETRKPADLLTLHGGSITDYVCQKDCPIAKPGRIKVEEQQVLDEYKIRYSDIDLNGHVNSVKYIEHILDPLPDGMVPAEDCEAL